MDNNCNKLPITNEYDYLRFRIPPLHVILQRYANDMAVCDIPCFFRNKYNAINLFYNQIGD